MIPLAYVLSRFPESYDTFISREINALERALATTLPVFSLKPHCDGSIDEEARRFLYTTYYPSVDAVLRATPTLFNSAPARLCLRHVFDAYGTQPWALTKAVVTLLLAAAILPTIRHLHVRHIHAHWATMPALAAYFIKQVCGVPYSITAHAWDIYAETTMLREKLQAAEFIVTCTATNCEELMHLGARRERVFLCYHGLEFDRLFDRRPGLYILAVGRLVEKKGFAYLIKACDLLHQRKVPFHCQVIGDGPLTAELRRLISRHRLDHVVSLVGACSQDEVFRAYKQATILCAPSVISLNGDRDGIPNVILEAMSQGLPVVASRLSGILEAVQPNKTGWLVSPGDSFSLAATLKEIHQAPQEARRRAEAAYELVRNQFDVQKNIATLLQLFPLEIQGSGRSRRGARSHELRV